MLNPLLDTVALPRFTEIQPDQIASALGVAIADQEAAVAMVIAAPAKSFEDVWMPLERASNMLDSIWSVVSHLCAVADSPALRTAHAEGEARLVAAGIAYAQNRELYDALVAFSATSAFATSDTADQVAVTRAIRDFSLSGVALDADARSRFRDISLELSGLSTDFGNAVLDATDAWEEIVTDEAILSGMSDMDKAMFRKAAEDKGVAGWRITLQQPSVSAILTFAQNPELRARIYRANVTRASDQGPHAGQFDNSPKIARMLQLRREMAELLGYPDYVALSLATKMAPDAAEVLGFLRDIAARAKETAIRELAEVRTFAAQHLGMSDVQPWDIGFVSNLLRKERYAIDEQEVRAYFPVERVMAGWQMLLERLFGIRLRERRDVPLYHADAQYFDVLDESGESFAGLYLDIHARPGKRGGAWMAPARARIADGNTASLPVAYLTCNFSPKGSDTPSLLSHGDIVTLLHETGHCLHHLFTRVDRPSIGGINGFEWDAIELPSQLMEDFAWDRDVLTAMSGHHATGAPLPADIYDRMLTGRLFQAGLYILRYVEFALFDLLLHLGVMGSDPIEVINAVREEVAIIHPPEWHRFPHSFSHIFAGSYAAGYYSYLWAELLAADGFQRFVEAGVVDRATGDDLRNEILSRGATRPAADSFRAFRGRNPDPAALLRRHGLVQTI